MVYAGDLKSPGPEDHAGSSPASGTRSGKERPRRGSAYGYASEPRGVLGPEASSRLTKLLEVHQNSQADQRDVVFGHGRRTYT
jgi:hypothetical protein